jgi:5'-AMP-activated protein kinase, regulatory gamma subunit
LQIVFPQALKLFMKGNHYIPVYDRIGVEGNVVGIVTSLKLLTLLSGNSAVVGAIGGAPIRDLFPLDASKVVSAPLTASTRSCFQTLLRHKFLGMPILSDDGTIVANLSMSDIRAVTGLTREQLNAKLDGTVGSYIDFAATLKARKPVLTVRSGDSLATAMELLSSHSVHRVYVVDTAGKITGVVTVTDILRVLDAVPA